MWRFNIKEKTFKSSSCLAATAFASFSFGETKLFRARVISGAVIAVIHIYKKLATKYFYTKLKIWHPCLLFTFGSTQSLRNINSLPLGKEGKEGKKKEGEGKMKMYFYTNLKILRGKFAALASYSCLVPRFQSLRNICSLPLYHNRATTPNNQLLSLPFANACKHSPVFLDV
jgi:hypothetical protein